MKRALICVVMLVFLLGAFNTTAFAKEGTYRFGAGDIIEISVWKDESLTRQVVVPPDGVISFPLIGEIDVTDLTARDLRAEVKKRLETYVPDATVSVMLIQLNSLNAYVIGKVNKPGQFPIDSNTNVMQVLSMAGGLNPFASAARILVLRQEGEKTVQIPFNYNQVEKGESLEQNVLLRRGDVVVVP